MKDIKKTSNAEHTKRAFKNKLKALFTKIVNVYSYIPIISLKATEFRVDISNSIPLLRFTFIPPL